MNNTATKPQENIKNQNNSEANRIEVNLESPSTKLYYYKNGKITTLPFDENVAFIQKENLIWIDLYKPSVQELERVERLLEIEIPDISEREEIEMSSRYWEEDGITTINSYFITIDNNEAIKETVSLILKDNFLLSVRYRKLHSFNELLKKILLFPELCNSGMNLLTNLLDIRIDFDADMLEKMAKDLYLFRKDIIISKITDEEKLRLISHFEEMNMKMRESLLDKSRIISSLIRNRSFSSENINELKIMLKDVNSLIDHAAFNFERLDSIQNIALASISIKQSKSMTIFTIANVLFLPPTLIASIYGMNFILMPELTWEFGYPFSVVLMVLSSITPYLYFKKKGWF